MKYINKFNLKMMYKQTYILVMICYLFYYYFEILFVVILYINIKYNYYKIPDH